MRIGLKLYLIILVWLLSACGGGSSDNFSVALSSSPPADSANDEALSDSVVEQEDTITLDYKVVNPSYGTVVNYEKREPDQRISYGDNALQFGDLWLPSNGLNNVPLLIFIHGGCWSSDFRLDYANAFASSVADNFGVAVWSLEYRSTGDVGGGWPGSYEDIVLALSKLSGLKLYGIDTSRVALAGHSAGGHLALLAASQPEAAQLSAVIGLAAIVDFASYAQGEGSCERAAVAFMGEPYIDSPEAYQLANPIGRTILPDVVLLHGGKDNIVPIENPRSSGFDLIEIDEAGHFDWVHPETKGFARLLDTLQSVL